jgi:hypothetical protein
MQEVHSRQVVVHTWLIDEAGRMSILQLVDEAGRISILMIFISRQEVHTSAC